MTLEVIRDEASATDRLKRAETSMRAGRFEEALRALDGAHDVEHDVEGRYLRAVCLRYLAQRRRAADALNALLADAPDFGRAWQELGHLRLDLARAAQAREAYERAVELNPALTASWDRLAFLHKRAGDETQARHAMAERNHYARMPREILGAWSLVFEGKLLKAEKLARAFMRRNPKHVEGMRVLAEIGARFGVLDDADFLLESALAFEPGNVRALIDHIAVLRKRQRHEQALAQAKRLYELAPDHPAHQSHYAVEKLQTGDFEGALALFDKVLERIPGDPATLTSRGHALKTYGRRAEAEASYKAAYRAKPDHGDAYYALANLKTYRFSDEEVAAMERAAAGEEAGPAAQRKRIHLNFALAKAYDDRGDHGAAFARYAEGNALKRAQSRYDADEMDAEFAAQKAVCTPDVFAAREGVGDPSPDPVFIVGLPRAGSTLIEQILASHSQVDGTLELPDVLALVQRLRGRGAGARRGAYPEILRDLEPQRFAEFGARYLKDTAIHRRGAPFFTDKMPNNFRHLGLIRLMLPNAKIIDARRHPMACCWSGFQQLFAEGQEFTYDLEDLGRYYRGYADLMDHWDRVLPGRVLRVIHEDVIEDLEGQVARILDFCGLPFEEACVAFHKTERSVRTASSEQVRRPINREGLDRWRAYETKLEPLKRALGPALADWRRPNGAG